MTLKEILENIDKEQVVSILVKTHKNLIDAVSLNILEHNLLYAMDEMIKMDVGEGKDIIFVLPQYGFDENNEIKIKLTSIFCKKTDIKQILENNVLFVDILNRNLFTQNWKTVLSSDVSDDCIKKYGKENVVAEILFDMTWFGCNYIEHTNNISKEKNRIQEYIFEENSSEDFADDVSELFEELGIDCPIDKDNIQFFEELEMSNLTTFYDFLHSIRGTNNG